MKKQLILPSAAVAAGAIAFVLRLIQNRTGFESGTGLPISGNIPGLLLVAWLLVSAILLVLLTRRLPKESGLAPALPADFSVSDPKYLVLPVMGVLLIALSGLVDILESISGADLLAAMQAAADPYAEVMVAEASFSGRLQLLLGILSLASAAALFFSAAACRKGGREDGSFSGDVLLLIPPVSMVVRLVLTYRLDSVNPALEAYYVELLALVFLTLAFYRLSSFAFQAGRTRRFTLYTCAATVLCFAALADGGPHLSSLLLYAGGAVALLGFLLLRLQHIDYDQENTTQI